MRWGLALTVPGSVRLALLAGLVRPQETLNRPVTAFGRGHLRSTRCPVPGIGCVNRRHTLLLQQAAAAQPVM